MAKKTSKKGNGKTRPVTTAAARVGRLLQTDLPSHSLREALTVAQALADNFGREPAAPHQVAVALNKSPTSSTWRSLSGAASAYGLTHGAAQSDRISLTELGRRATAATIEGDDIKAKAEAALRPTLLAKFFKRYDRSKFPTDVVAKNVLEHQHSVAKDKLDEVLAMLKDNGQFVGHIHQTKTGPFVSIEDLSPSPVTIETPPEAIAPAEGQGDLGDTPLTKPTPAMPVSAAAAQARTPATALKVFITHGKNMGIVSQVKDVLDLYDIAYEVAVEEETTAIPVPHKVLAAMRRCNAGLMVVSADDDDAAASGHINNNVLIEIGAAFVLYDQKVVLLWDKRLKVPSNLQGLYRCEFETNNLTFGEGTKLAKAIKGFRPPDATA